MKFYDEMKLLYLETDVSRVGLVAGILHTREGTSCPRNETSDGSALKPIAFACKGLSATEKKYSKIEREALGILHGLK